MLEFPERPFLNRDFSPSGGGIDYLGMRWVNLKLLSDFLIPAINNATRDFGTYCLATWIPWKFRQLCGGRDEFVLSNYRRFQERVEVAVSHALRSESPATEKFGDAHNRIGVQQKLDLPAQLSFSTAKRTRTTSIFSAPLYGPSLRYLGLIQGDALAEDGTSTEIPIAAEDDGTRKILETVDRAISKSAWSEKLSRQDTPTFKTQEIDDLGLHGLHPSFYRNCSTNVKIAFLEKLVPDDGSHGRTLTARLLATTLRQRPGLQLDEIRAAWHTGQFSNSRPLRLADPQMVVHRERWAIFQSRQYQRYIVELFMLCFELALMEGLTSIASMSDFTLRSLDKNQERPRTLKDIVILEAGQVTSSRSYNTMSARWNRDVHGGHPAYLWQLRTAEVEDDAECERGLRLLARWWIQMVACLTSEPHRDLLLLGGEDRISMKWFFQWVENRLDWPLGDFIRDVFEQLVFGQHIRVALSRFDGKSQRLRFVLGDDGIVPTRSAKKKLTAGLPGWTADRLWSFTRLLCDLSVLQEDANGGLEIGELADAIK